MPLRWNEIKTGAIAFYIESAHQCSEDAQGNSFWAAFFEVFGVHRRCIARFGVPIQHESGSVGLVVEGAG